MGRALGSARSATFSILFRVLTMSLENERQQILDEDRIDTGNFIKALAAGLRWVFLGWRAAPRHEHDAEDVAAAEADRKVNDALAKARAKLLEKDQT